MDYLDENNNELYNCSSLNSSYNSSNSVMHATNFCQSKAWATDSAFNLESTKLRYKPIDVFDIDFVEVTYFTEIWDVPTSIECVSSYFCDAVSIEISEVDSSLTSSLDSMKCHDFTLKPLSKKIPNDITDCTHKSKKSCVISESSSNFKPRLRSVKRNEMNFESASDDNKIEKKSKRKFVCQSSKFETNKENNLAQGMKQSLILHSFSAGIDKEKSTTPSKSSKIKKSYQATYFHEQYQSLSKFKFCKEKHSLGRKRQKTIVKKPTLSKTMEMKKQKTCNGRAFENKSYICSYCNKIFKSSSNLNTHIVLHTGLRPFTCAYCFEGFKQKAHLKAHIMRHTGEKPYSCRHCSFACIQKTSLMTHEKSIHANKDKDCSECYHK